MQIKHHVTLYIYIYLLTFCRDHRIMVRPKAHGKVTWIAPAGEYTIIDTVMKTEFNGKETNHTMLQVCI